MKFFKNTCIFHDLDYIKILNSIKVYVAKLKEFNDISLSTAFAIIAYTRIYINNIKLDIINKGGQIYYSDTDSIITNISLNKKMVDKDIRQFKLEYLANKRYFILFKLYYLIVTDCFIVIKPKSAFKSFLNLDDFINIYKDINVKAVR